jgi:nucleoid-associated protein YgaU
METLRNLWGDLWQDKPLLITLGVGVAIVAYIIYKANPLGGPATPATSSEIAPTSSGTGGMGTFVEESSYVGPVTKNITISNPVTSGVSGNTPASTMTTTPPPPTGGTPSPSPVSHPSGKKMVTVQKWPAQQSTLWGIAQSVYGNGALWPKIYQANKSMIGSNPNVLQPGWVLTIP